MLTSGVHFTEIIMKLLSLKSTFAALALALSTGAHALTITPSGILGTDNSNLSPSEIGTLHNLGSLSLLYKTEVGGQDSGPFAGSYNTTYTNTANDPSGAIISYTGLPALVPSANPLYLYVKDGNASPAYYVINVSAWNGMEDLVLQNFWPQQGAISNLQLLGGITAGEIPPRDIDVPGVADGGSTVLLLGTGLMVLALLRRKFLS
jgi:hypothetical protein